jgi:hypothetical protein
MIAVREYFIGWLVDDLAREHFDDDADPKEVADYRAFVSEAIRENLVLAAELRRVS